MPVVSVLLAVCQECCIQRIVASCLGKPGSHKERVQPPIANREHVSLGDQSFSGDVAQRFQKCVSHQKGSYFLKSHLVPCLASGQWGQTWCGNLPCALEYHWRWYYWVWGCICMPSSRCQHVCYHPWQQWGYLCWACSGAKVHVSPVFVCPVVSFMKWQTNSSMLESVWRDRKFKSWIMEL